MFLFHHYYYSCSYFLLEVFHHIHHYQYDDIIDSFLLECEKEFHQHNHYQALIRFDLPILKENCMNIFHYLNHNIHLEYDSKVRFIKKNDDLENFQLWKDFFLKNPLLFYLIRTIIKKLNEIVLINMMIIIIYNYCFQWIEKSKRI